LFFRYPIIALKFDARCRMLVEYRVSRIKYREIKPWHRKNTNAEHNHG
jgi:hypothetical protein